MRSLRRPPRVWFVLSAFVMALGLVACQPAASTPGAPVDSSQTEAAHGEEEPELAAYMSAMQRWAHKTALAVEAENGPLADFYLHEMEETVETVQAEVPRYEGYEIATLTKQMLVPSLDSLDAAVDAADWTRARERLRTVATSCNQCHQATDHGFVQIKLEGLSNPFPQSFEARTMTNDATR